MKLINSETTTQPKQLFLQTGMPDGGRGLGTPESLGQSNQDALASALQRIKHSLQSPLDTAMSRNDLLAQADRLSVPASPSWIMARVAALLDQFYEKGVSQQSREFEADDWLVALRGNPKWAIDAAIRWWKSAGNERRHRRPLEGDIAARVAIEMDAVRAAQVKIAAFDSGLIRKANLAEEPRVVMTAEQRAAQAVALGLPAIAHKAFPSIGDETE